MLPRYSLCLLGIVALPLVAFHPVYAQTYTAGAGLALTGNTFSIPSAGVTSTMLHPPLSLSASSSSPIIKANNTSTGNGGSFSSSSGNGVAGSSSSSSSYGGYFTSVNGNGVYGHSDGANNSYGGYFTSVLGTGVYGSSDSATDINAAGVYGINIQSGNYGLLGGVNPIDGITVGVYGSNSYNANYIGGYGVYGNSSLPSSTGVYGTCSGRDGVGVAGSVNDNGYGVAGNSGSGDGVSGFSQSGVGVYGSSTSGKAGYFYGNVTVTGAITAGTKNFKIDHPLDPANKFLYHASVESDKMEDIYNGHVILDASGSAFVKMPDWFQALNTDFEYHLTPIGAPAPNLFVAQEITHNKFKIAGGEPGMKVSWQVVGVRHDAFALTHPLQVEQDKSEQEQGLYQNPEAFGQPVSMGIGYSPQQNKH